MRVILAFLLRKQAWLDMAELIDAWRVTPRAILAGYGYLIWDMWKWVEGRPDLTTQQAAFTGAIIAMGVPLAGLYFTTGRRWDRSNSTG